MCPRVPNEKYITEKYRIWMEGEEAERAPAPLSLSPPAGSRGLWEGRAEVASAKVPPAGWCRLPELGGTHACPPLLPAPASAPASAPPGDLKQAC